MKFTTAANFRTSLETRLGNRARAEGKDVNRLRMQVAFERFLARIFHSQEAWVLKGGYALEVRLHERARSTVDLDLGATAQADFLTVLQQAASTPLGDYFEFTVRGQGTGLLGPPEGGQRFHVESRLAGRTFARFHVDLGLGDVLTSEPDWIEGQVDLDFADLPRTRLRVYPLATHFAEKVHAFTRPRERQTRVKDLVDLALLLTLNFPADEATLAALRATFERYGSHDLPPQMPAAPAAWATPFQQLATQTGLEPRDLSFWEQQLADFWQKLPWSSK